MGDACSRCCIRCGAKGYSLTGNVRRFRRACGIDASAIIDALAEAQSRNKDVIFALYGHTTFHDGVLSVRVMQQAAKGGFQLRGVSKRRDLTPPMFWKHFIFMSKKGKNTEAVAAHSGSIGLWVEGTRSKATIRSGFFHLAKAKKADVVFAVVDYRRDAVLCTPPTHWEELPEEFSPEVLEPLQKLIDDLGHKDIAVYPNGLTPLPTVADYAVPH